MNHTRALATKMRKVEEAGKIETDSKGDILLDAADADAGLPYVSSILLIFLTAGDVGEIETFWEPYATFKWIHSICSSFCR